MILLFIINILVIWGLRHCFEPNEILGFVRSYTIQILIKWPKSMILCKPLFDCVYCMSSIWSVPFYIYGIINYNFSLYYWPVWAVCLVGISGMIIGQTDLTDIKTRIKNLEDNPKVRHYEVNRKEIV